MGWLKRLFANNSPNTKRITVDDPLVILSPKMGFLNLAGASAVSDIAQDKAVLSPLFSSVEESDSHSPHCDVLMIYARVEHGGAIANSSLGLRDIIRESGAAIVIVASQNEAQNYIAVGKQTGYGQANLVMTLNRKGAAFADFFRQLFAKMFEGKSMLLAWVELAPQVPGAGHENCPEAIFAAEVSHIVFKNAAAISKG